MKRLPGDASFTLLLLAVALVLLVLTLRLGPSARLVPLTVVVPLTALLTYRLVRDVTGRDGVPPNEPASRALSEQPSPRGERAMIAWLLTLPLLAALLGFIGGVAAFVLAWTRFRAGERLRTALVAALAAGAAVWLIFERLLHVPLPPGVWHALPIG